MKPHTMKTFYLWVLVLFTILPYITSFIPLKISIFYGVEIIALIFWYVSSLTIPIIMNEVSSSLLFWVYHLVLVGIPIGSDLVYRITDITPRMWWQDISNLMPVTWYIQGLLTRHYYSYLSILTLLLAPGCVFFFVSTYWIKKTSQDSEKS